MEKYYIWDTETHKYIGEYESQIDPLETEKAGHTVYCGLPTNGTYDKPLTHKENCEIVWNGNEWAYQEIQQEKTESVSETKLEPEQEPESEPEPEQEPEPTQEEIQARMRSLRKYYLFSWDFSQLRDAPFTEEEKNKIAEYRQYLRDYTKEENWWMAEPLKYEDWLVGYKPISK